jgi:hypothetical protein
MSRLPGVTMFKVGLARRWRPSSAFLSAWFIT